MSILKTKRLKMLRTADNWWQCATVDDDGRALCAPLISGHEIVLAEERRGKPAAYCPPPGSIFPHVRAHARARASIGNSAAEAEVISSRI